MNCHQKMISWIYRPNYGKIKKSIIEAEIVSFDIYDTMIRRNVMSPTDIFELVGIEFKNITGRSIENYKELRCKSEHIARNVCNSEEISFEQIFENMKGFSEKERETLKELEIRYEISMSCPNERIIELYKFALKKKKRVIITSDMYLEEKVIKEILGKNGIREYEKLYISSTCGKKKHKGSLYKFILRDLQVEPKNIVHIGDSIQGDIIQAQKNGIKTCLVPRYIHNLKYWRKSRSANRNNKVQYSILKAFLQNNIYDNYSGENGTAKRIGFEVLGPILVGYSMWLNSEVKKNEIDRIFFLSREGQILQQAYDILYGKSAIFKSYLYVSRRAVIVPLISSARNFDELIDIIKILMKTPELKTICNICSLNGDEYRERLMSIGLTENDSVYNIKNKEQLFEIIREMVYEESERQRKYFINYLRQESFIGNVLLSDSGWSGTIQQVIQDLLIDDTQLHIRGAYIGVRNVKTKDKYKQLDRAGFLFTPSRNQKFDYMTRFTNEILEKLLSNGEGSTLGYKDEGEIRPILAKRTVHDKGTPFVRELQKEALKFVKMFSESLEIFEKLNIDSEVFFNGYINFAVYPTQKNVRVFSDFNSKYETLQPIVPKRNIFYYILHMKELKQDLSTYCSIFLLKKILIFPLPYYEILTYLVDKIGVKSDYRKKCENGLDNKKE